MWISVVTSNPTAEWIARWMGYANRHRSAAEYSQLGHSRRSESTLKLPVYPQHRTSSGSGGRSQKCQQETFRPQPGGSIRPIAPPLNPLALAREGLVLGHDSQSL